MQAQAKTAQTSRLTIRKLIIQYRTFLILVVLVTVFSLLKPIFDKLFGEGWRKKDRDFWDEFDEKQLSSRDDIQKME